MSSHLHPPPQRVRTGRLRDMTKGNPWGHIFFFALPLFWIMAVAGTCIGLVGSIFTIQRFLKV